MAITEGCGVPDDMFVSEAAKAAPPANKPTTSAIPAAFVDRADVFRFFMIISLFDQFIERAYDRRVRFKVERHDLHVAHELAYDFLLVNAQGMLAKK